MLEEVLAGPGCAKAGEGEVTALLGALHQEGEALRDAALRGLKVLMQQLGAQGEDFHQAPVRRAGSSREHCHA